MNPTKTWTIRILRFIGSSLFRFLEGMLAITTIYFICYFLISFKTIDALPVQEPKNIQIYLSTNGVHTDFVIPIRSQLKNWELELNISDALKVDTFQTHFAIGWGDKNFFLKTKNWGDLTVGTAAKAIFGTGEGAMHLVLCCPKDLDPNTLIPLKLTEKQYQKLCSFISESFSRENDQVNRIAIHPYGPYNLFFDSSRSYSMLYTCNSWTNEGLKVSGQKCCVWTPFKGAIWAKYGR